MDAASWAFPWFDWLTDRGCGFVIRARAVRAERVARVLYASAAARDRVVKPGLHRSNPCAHPARVVEIKVNGAWRPYPTNVPDPAVLSAADAVDLCGRRWRIGEAFPVTKRLLGLGYPRSGASNAVAPQVWATWLLYAVLGDPSDAVAEEPGRPVDAVSLEMAFRGLDHFTGAFHRSEAADPVACLAARPDLGLVKRRRKDRERRRGPLEAWRQELNL